MRLPNLVQERNHRRHRRMSPRVHQEANQGQCFRPRRFHVPASVQKAGFLRAVLETIARFLRAGLETTARFLRAVLETTARFLRAGLETSAGAKLVPGPELQQ